MRAAERAMGVVVAATLGACSAQPAGTASPTAPSVVSALAQASVAGEWTVTYRVDASIGRYAFTRVGQERELTLRLQQIGDRVTGAMLSDGLVANVDGRLDAEGRLSLSGHEVPPIPDHGSLELRRFDAVVDAAQGLAGALEYQSLIPGEHALYSTGATGPIVRAERTPLAISSFAGRWNGFFTTTACSSERGCLLDHWSFLELDLADSGGLVAGTLQLGSFLRLPLVGSASGSSVELRTAEHHSTRAVLRASRSATGRLTGSVTITDGWTTTIELLSVALAPRPAP